MTTQTQEQELKGLFSKTEGIIELPTVPFNIQNSKNVLIISDLHFPFHDKRAVEIAVNYQKKNDTIVILGDMLDFYGLSRFIKRPDMPTIREELNLGISFFIYLREKHPKARIIFYEGNHEQRLDNYIMSKAPALFGIEHTTLEIFLKLKENGIEFVRNGHIMQLGELYLIHGNETGIRGGINVSRTMMLRTFDNTLFGNFHKTQISSAKSVSGREFATFSIGCLCGLKPQYMPINEWNLGFSFIEVYGDEFEVNNKRILSNYNVR